MRIYLRSGKQIRDDSGVVHLYSAPNFYDVDETLGEAWVVSGDANHATAANEIIESPATTVMPED